MFAVGSGGKVSAGAKDTGRKIRAAGDNYQNTFLREVEKKKKKGLPKNKKDNGGVVPEKTLLNTIPVTIGVLAKETVTRGGGGVGV